MTTAAATTDRRVLADLVPGGLVRDVVLVVGAAALTGVAAQVVIPTLAGADHPPDPHGAPLRSCPRADPRRPVDGPLSRRRRGRRPVVRRAEQRRRASRPLGTSSASCWRRSSSGGWRGAARTARTAGRSAPWSPATSSSTPSASRTWRGRSASTSRRRSESARFRSSSGDALKILLAAGLLPAAWRIAGTRRLGRQTQRRRELDRTKELRAVDLHAVHLRADRPHAAATPRAPRAASAPGRPAPWPDRASRRADRAPGSPASGRG